MSSEKSMEQVNSERTVASHMTLLGVFLYRKRKRRGLSLQDLFVQTGINPSTISRIENGVTDVPKDEHLIKLGEALRVPVSVLSDLVGRRYEQLSPDTVTAVGDVDLDLVPIVDPRQVDRAIEQARATGDVPLLQSKLKMASDLYRTLASKLPDLSDSTMDATKMSKWYRVKADEYAESADKLEDEILDATDVFKNPPY